MLQKYLPNESHVLQPQAVKMDSQMLYGEEPKPKATNSFGEGHLESS